MKRCLVVGKPNVGKTLFVIRFAGFLGVRRLDVERSLPGGGASVLRLAAEAARRELVGASPHRTTCLQAVAVRLPQKHGRTVVHLVDTTALADRVHPDPGVRQGMAQTLEALHTADMVLHVVDAAAAGRHGTATALGEIDRQIAAYAGLRIPYLVLANKMDLPWARTGLVRVRDQFPPTAVIPVSAVSRAGFREVRAAMAQRL